MELAAGPSATATPPAPIRPPAPSVLDTIGSTPLVRLTGYLDVPEVSLHLKLESGGCPGSRRS